jgi:hypothetical protein
VWCLPDVGLADAVEVPLVAVRVDEVGELRELRPRELRGRGKTTTRSRSWVSFQSPGYQTTGSVSTSSDSTALVSTSAARAS